MQRGWIEENRGKFQVSALGQEIRQAAEDGTNRYYYVLWSCLRESDAEDLFKLLKRLQERLQEGLLQS